MRQWTLNTRNYHETKTNLQKRSGYISLRVVSQCLKSAQTLKFGRALTTMVVQAEKLSH